MYIVLIWLHGKQHLIYVVCQVSWVLLAILITKVILFYVCFYSRRTLCPGRQPRHGGVNPTFTPYDEIWTWIPVVTDSQNNCNSQINPSARQNSAPNDTNISTVSLPSYEHAVRQSTTTVPRNSAQVNETSTQRVSESQYDTIPVDLATRSRTSGGITAASVSRPSNTLSALTAALQSPLPERRGEPMAREAPRRGNNSEQQNNNRERNTGRYGSSNVTHVDEIRERSQQFYRQYNGIHQRQRVVTTNPGNAKITDN